MNYITNLRNRSMSESSEGSQDGSSLVQRNPSGQQQLTPFSIGWQSKTNKTSQIAGVHSAAPSSPLSCAEQPRYFYELDGKVPYTTYERKPAFYDIDGKVQYK